MKVLSGCENGFSRGIYVKPKVTTWQIPPHKLTLQKEEIHLWRFNLECSEHIYNQLKKLLDPKETVRADRLLDLQKKKQFIISRARLRQILGAYQKVPPSQIQFKYNNYGKPALAELYHSSLSFNLSHSDNWAVLAVADNSSVGVDLEKIDPDLNFTSLANQYFDKRENKFLEKYPTERQRRGFYRLWTQKEAMLKLNGFGFRKTTQNIEGSITVNWDLKTFPLLEDYICSIATQEQIISIKKS